MLDKEATTEEWLKGHAPMDSGASLPDGTEVGRWRIVAFVARGGSGEVYRAVETEGSRTAALKILHRTDDAAVARFAREVQVLSELRDRAFPVFFESGTFGGRPWYATEFLQPLDMPATDHAVARFIVAVCRGAGALHARGYVHRDIKPANILFRKDEPVLIDLGLLKKAETPALHTGGTVSVVDGRPVGVGTPGYAAPEQFMGGEISPAADIHAIGVLASACFGGRPPHAWRAIIRRATSSLPGERYPDVATLARAVRLRHLPTALGATAVAVAITTATTVLWSNGVRSSARDTAMETRETAPSIPSPPSASPLAQAFAAVPEGAAPPTQPEVEPNPATTLATTPASVPQIEEQPKAPVPKSTPEPASEFAPKSKRGHVSYDDEPIIASERLRNILADQGRILPNVTPNQIREVLDKLGEGMVPIPGRDFEICKFELTQSIWVPIAGFNPSKEVGPDIPVSNVTMADIEEFLESLNDLPEVRASGRKYRLPTAEEWEYACLAGGTNGFCRLADGTQITPETLGEVAWFAGNSGNKPHPVCKKKPNAFGLYDMHGNVAEFTSTRRPNDMFEYIWKGNAYNGEKPNGFRADLSPSLTYGISYYIAGFRLAR